MEYQVVITKVNTTANPTTHFDNEDIVEMFIEQNLLPTGSGFNSDWSCEISQVANPPSDVAVLTFRTSFSVLKDGGYAGGIPVSLRVSAIPPYGKLFPQATIDLRCLENANFPAEHVAYQDYIYDTLMDPYTLDRTLADVLEWGDE